MMGRSNLTPLAGLFLLHASLALSGCGGDTEQQTERAESEATSAAATTGAAPSTASAEGASDELSDDDLSLRVLDPALSLEDQDGQPFAFERVAGHPVLLSFFYARCDTMCPLIVSDLRAVEASLPDEVRAEVRVVLVTIDPRHDTKERLREVMQERNLPTDRWSLVRGSDDDVRTLASTVGMNYRPIPNGEFAHNATLIVLDDHGVVRAQTLGTGRPVEPLVEALTRIARSRS